MRRSRSAMTNSPCNSDNIEGNASAQQSACPCNASSEYIYRFRLQTFHKRPRLLAGQQETSVREHQHHLLSPIFDTVLVLLSDERKTIVREIINSATDGAPPCMADIENVMPGIHKGSQTQDKLTEVREIAVQKVEEGD